MSDEAWRSVAEQRWSIVFDQIGWEWDYEYGCFGNYLPDFLLSTTGRNGIICEIKGGAQSESELSKQAAKLWNLRHQSGLRRPTLLALPNAPRKKWGWFRNDTFACGLIWSYRADRPVPVTFASCDRCGVGLLIYPSSGACVACRDGVAHTSQHVDSAVYDAWQIALVKTNGPREVGGPGDLYFDRVTASDLDAEYTSIVDAA